MDKEHFANAPVMTSLGGRITQWFGGVMDDDVFQKQHKTLAMYRRSGISDLILDNIIVEVDVRSYCSL